MTLNTVSNFSTVQQTIATSCVLEGVGVHSGKSITLTLLPAAENSGIVFKRTDIEASSKSCIPALLKYVVDTKMCTTIANEFGTSISTIEHLMAALYACEIDNLVIEINGAEVPIMDGSSQPFIEAIKSVGVQSQQTGRTFIKVLKPIIIDNEYGSGKLLPSHTVSYTSNYDFKGRADFGDQSFTVDGAPGKFIEMISQARTFGFLEDAEKVWAMGLAKGTSLENTVVIDENKVINEEGLRFDTEFVRHKILDTVGDLYLAGSPLLCEFEGINCGHTHNNALLKALFENCENWKLVSYEAPKNIEHSTLVFSPGFKTQNVSYSHSQSHFAS